MRYYNTFLRTLEMPLSNCEINVIVIWSEKCVISEGNRVTTFAITDAKLYVPVVTLSTQDNTKLTTIAIEFRIQTHKDETNI